MAQLMPLLEALQQHHGSASSTSDPQLQLALRRLASLLRILPSHLYHRHRREVDVGGEAAQNKDDAAVVVEEEDRHGAFTRSQLEFIFELTEAVVVRYLHVPLEDGMTEPIEGVFINTVEMCVQAFKSFDSLTLGDDDTASLKVLNKILVIMESAFEKKTKECLHSCKELPTEVLQGLEEVLQSLNMSETENASFPKDIRGYGFRDASGDVEKTEMSEDIMALLTSEHVVESEILGLDKSNAECLNIQTAIQSYAVCHANIHSEFLNICKNFLLKIDCKSSEDESRHRNDQLSLVSHMLKLLCSLSRIHLGFHSREDIVKGLVAVICRIENLFTQEVLLNMDEADQQASSYVAFLTSIVAAIESVDLDNCITQNLKLFLVGKALDMMVRSEPKANTATVHKKLSVIWQPQVVSYIFGLIKALHIEGNKGSKQGSSGLFTLKVQLHGQDFDLGAQRSQNELLLAIFSSDNIWLPSLLRGVGLMYTMGMEVRPVAEVGLLLKKDTSGSSLAEAVPAPFEEEALFGNLFSEASRQSSLNESSYQSGSVDYRPRVLRDTTLQAVADVLAFLKDSIFCLNSPLWLFNLVQKQINEKGIDVILEMFLHVSSQKIDLILRNETTSQLSKVSFSLLDTIVSSRVLSGKLDEYLVSKILEKGYKGCTMPNKILVLLAKLLINRSTLQGSGKDDTLQLVVFNNFVDRVINSIEKGEWVDVSAVNSVEKLPSVFCLEVLLMVFHSSNGTSRSSMIHKVKQSLKHFCTVNIGSSLCASSLLFSRMLMLLRYMVSHEITFSSSLLVDLRLKLSHFVEDASSSNLEDRFSLPSVPATLGHDLKDAGPVCQQSGLSDDFLSHLFEINLLFSGNSLRRNNLVNKSEMADILSTIRCFLDSWKGSKIDHVEELLVERYAFLSGWAVVCDFSEQTEWKMPSFQSIDVSSAEFHLRFTESLYSFLKQGRSRVIENDGKEWWNVFMQTLTSIETANVNSNVKTGITDKLRQSSLLKMIISFLLKGLEVFLVDQGIISSRRHDHEESELFCEKLVNNCITTQSLNNLLKVLLSLIPSYVESFHLSVLSILGEQEASEVSSSSVCLVLRGGLSWTKQDQLFTRLGVSFSPLHTLLRRGMPLTWISDNLSKCPSLGNMGTTEKLFLPSLLHGHPCSYHPGSAMVMSSISLIDALLETIKLILKVCSSECANVLGTNGLSALLDVLLTIKLEEIFETLHSKSEDVLCALLPSEEERSQLCDLHLLKQKESLLKSISGKNDNITETVREELIQHVVEVFSNVYLVKNDVFQKYFTSSGGNLSSLMDVLDGCHQETVNVKVLQFLMTVMGSDNASQSDLRCQLQEKLIYKEPSALCLWLEQRLLGSVHKAGEANQIFVPSSSLVRDLTVAFINALLTSEFNLSGKDLRTHLLSALLLSLEQAFTSLDNGGLMSYFSLLFSLANNRTNFRYVLSTLTDLMSKLPGESFQMDGLQTVLMFLTSVLHSYGGQQTLALGKTGDGKQGHASSSRLSSTSNKTKQSLHNKTLEVAQTVLENNGLSMSAECDVVSADEDEDDGTSDGEITSMEKDEDDEGNNSEKALASKVCTFTSSGNNFMAQHWYFCYTCDLTVSKGCCSVCARVCHRGHRVVYSRHSRFFCDCGAGSVRGQNCLCLKPRKYVSSSATVPAADQESPSDSDSDVDEDVWVENERFPKMSIHEGEERKILDVFTEVDVEKQILALSERLMNNLIKKKCSISSVQGEISLGDEKRLNVKNDFMHLRRIYKSGSFDMKIKADYVNAKELKAHLANGTLFKSLLSTNSKGKLAAGEGDKVTIFDVEHVIGQPSSSPVTVDKTNLKNLSKNHVRFELVHLVFNAVNENYLAVAGYEDCQIFTVNNRGEVVDRLAVELALQGAYIRRVNWVPGSQVQLMVVTNKFVKIYDLSQDNISPVHYFTVLEDDIVDASLISMGQGQHLLVVLSLTGTIYTHQIITGADPGACVLTDILLIPERFKPGKGVSLHYSSALRLIFISFSDGLSLIGRLDSSQLSVTEVSNIVDIDQEGKPTLAGLHHWTELQNGCQTLFTCLSSQRSNSAVAVSLGSTEIQPQYMRITGNSASCRVDGITGHKSLLKDKYDILILNDDGSLQVFTFGPAGEASIGDPLKISKLEAEQIKKLGDVILGNKVNNSPAPVFPVDFFEKTTCITQDIKLSGDVLRNLDSEGAKSSLTSDDGFLEGPNTNGFKITIHNRNPDMVMVGCRVQVGNSNTSHIPSELRIFHRTIKLDEGMRCWYDLPFTNAESLVADEEFTLFVGPTFGGFSLPRIDSLEVYGRSKEEFGWKEKLDSFLDTESHGSVSESPNRLKLLKNASSEEQIVADCFRLLYSFYVTMRIKHPLEAVVLLEGSRKKCKSLFESVFECDRQPLLQASARRCLRALYPTKDAFYQAKDTLRLTGVSRMCPILAPKIGLSVAVMPQLVQDFASQLRAVCKIALHRRSNFASFIDSHGSALIEDLMKVLWEFLTVEQPDSETVNNLVIPSVDLIYGYAECLVNRAGGTSASAAPAIALLKQLLFAPNETVRAACSLAISSRLLQVPIPKQTILTNDDVGESPGPTSVATGSGAAGGGSDSHGMMEEDAGSASVQYCCDGCSTVPIVGRRWHCNLCPDFDLCEACYEVMDGDPPPPHSRDHPMSAIPIDIDNHMAGEVSDIRFASIDELSDDNLLQVATGLGMRPDSSIQKPSVDSSDGKDEQPSTSTDFKDITISASKRDLNSLILKSLVDDIKGWTRTTSGSQAVPLMQFFYRLASASSSSSPFVDAPGRESISLERFIRLLLDEINLGTQLSIKPRSNFGEVVILVFTFFNLMLRNWHQPGSDHSLSKSAVKNGEVPNIIPSSGTGSPSSDECVMKGETGSQLDKACAALRQQQLLNYLFSILQQLAQVFKSSRSQESLPVGSAGALCGALLTVRKDFVAGNFAPYFTDSYAKAHRSDLFCEFHRLLLESTFRLAYNLVRPEKTSDKDQVSSKLCVAQDLKLDGWQEVLCSYINNPHTTTIRRFARRLLLYLCGSKGHYYNVRDSWQLSREVKKLFKLAQKAGGFHALLVYEKSVKLVKCLSSIVEVAAARPRNWQKYCSKHPDVLQFLLNGVFVFGEESVVQTLKLLTLAFYAGKDVSPSSTKGETIDANPGVGNVVKGNSQASDTRKKKKGTSEDSIDNAAEKSFLDMELAVDLFAAEDGKVLRHFIGLFLLEWNAACVRTEAKAVLMGAWHHGRPTIQEMILKLLLEKITVLPSYGQNITEYTALLTWILEKGVSKSPGTVEESSVVLSCLNTDVAKVFFDTLRSQNELLANHPNSRIYNTLSSLVEFDGYYLESEPCLACSCPEIPYSRMKLDSLKSETKFTDNRILVKCIGSHTIQSVTMNVHDARRSKSVKVLNLYYNNKPVTDLSELKNNWSLWKKAKTCHLAFNQTELKVDFPIPITACNFMIELDSFYENLQASSMESLQCPRCSRYVTDKHGICGNCHENAYQCRQCRNINYENLDSFLCNECGYSKYGRFEFNFMAKPSFNFESMENDEDMKKGLAAIEMESENAHKRYQQLLGFKKPLLKLVSSIGESEMDSQQKDSVQQMVSLPGSASFKINRKISILGILYGEKCKMAFDSVSRSVQNLQGLRRVLTSYLEQKRSSGTGVLVGKLLPSRPSNRCYGCANTFVGHCLEWLQVLAKISQCKQQLVSSGILSELFENNIHQGSKLARAQARSVLCAFTEGDATAVTELNTLIKQKAMYCLDHHRSVDIASCVREELQLLSETCALVDEFWESRLRVVFQLLFSSIRVGARNPVIADHIILPCLKIISQACTPPKVDATANESDNLSSEQKQKSDMIDGHTSSTSRADGNAAPKGQPSSVEKDEQDNKSPDIALVSYTEWENGATYLDFVRRQYKASKGVKPAVQKSRQDPNRADFLALKYLLRWKRRACRNSLKNDLSAFEDSSWVCELALSACSQAIRVEICGLIEVLCSQSPARKSKFLNLLMTLLPSTRSAGESASDYFELLFKMIESEDARLFLTVRGFLKTLCRLITEEVVHIESQEHTFHIDISQGYILHKLIELLGKFLQVANIRLRFMKDGLLPQVLEALLVVRGLVVQKTKLISDCSHLLRDLLDGLLEESFENKRHFIRACVVGLQSHAKSKKDRTIVYMLELLCNIICPTKPEPAYMMVLNKAHTQEEFIRGSMTKNPYSSLEIGPLMRDVKNKICHQLDLVGLIEDDYGMELLVAGNIISLDLSVAQVYEQVWRKAQTQQTGSGGSSTLVRECPPMTVTYRLQGLDGEATEPMIKELEDDREETQDPEVEFAIAGVMRECNGLEIILDMVQGLNDNDIKSSQEEFTLVLKLLMYCCKIRENRLALLRLGALGILIETARRAFVLEASESAEGLLLIVESLVTEANESDIGMAKTSLSLSKDLQGSGDQAAYVVHMFLERLSQPSTAKKANKKQRNNNMVARILPYLTYGLQEAMEVLVKHFEPYLHDFDSFDQLIQQHHENESDENLSRKAAEHQLALENFCKVVESIKNDAQGERLKGLIMHKGITKECIQHLRSVFSILDKSRDYKNSVEWARGLEMPSIPIILMILRGLSSGHLATQRCLSEEGVLPLLHALEGVSVESEIGARAENLLDTIADKEGKGEGFLAGEVTKLRHATKDEMRKRALQKREELLQELGMRREFTSGGERIVISQPSIEGLEDVLEEEAGLACMVCREGYSICPNDMLGTYCYSKRVNLGIGSGGNTQAEWVYTTVSHFNVIHFQCHLEAKRADASLKNPKKEWEGAAIRNNETLCNNLFPLRGPAVSLPNYARCVDLYWDNLSALGRADGSRLRLLTYDIVLMLARFATGASFSTDSKGGGKESNSRMLPFMLQMAWHLLEQGGITQKKVQAKALATYLNSSLPDSSASTSRPPPGSPQRVAAVDETVQFMMVQSLLLESLDDWVKHRRLFLQRGIFHACMQFKHGRTSLTSSPLPPSPVARSSAGTSTSAASEKSVEDESQSLTISKDKLFSVVQPMLTYTGLIDQLQHYLKRGVKRKEPAPAVPADQETGSTTQEPWEVTMKERLLDVKSMLGFSKELLEWLDDMQGVEDLQEAFDTMGALGDALANHKTCEDFILDIISSSL